MYNIFLFYIFMKNYKHYSMDKLIKEKPKYRQYWRTLFKYSILNMK